MKKEIIMKVKLFSLTLALLFCISGAMALNFSVVGELPYHTQMHGLVAANGYIYVISPNNENGDSAGLCKFTQLR